MKKVLLIFSFLYSINSFCDVLEHYIYSDINMSKNIIKATVINSNNDIVTFSIDSVLLGDCDLKTFTLYQNELRYKLYGCVYAPQLNIGEVRILFFKNYLKDTIDLYKLQLDLKVDYDKILLPNTVRIGIDYEDKILEKNYNSFFDRKLPINQLYEAIRIMNLCNNLDRKSKYAHIKCDDARLMEIAKQNLIIKAWIK